MASAKRMDSEFIGELKKRLAVQATISPLSSAIIHNEDEQNVQQERFIWYQARLLREILLGTAFGPQENTDYDNAFLHEIKSTLLRAEAEQIVSQEAEIAEGVLGATDLPPQDDCMVSTSKLIDLIDAKLRKKLQVVSKFYRASNTPNLSSHLEDFKAANIHTIVEKDVEAVKQQKCEINRLKEQNIEQLQVLTEIYSSELEKVHRLISEYILHNEASHDDVMVKNLNARAEALALKLRLLEYGLLTESYQKDTVQALSAIKEKIDSAIAADRAALDKANKAYAACLAAGKDFEAIALEYSQTMKDISTRKWALDELKTSQRKQC